MIATATDDDTEIESIAHLGRRPLGSPTLVDDLAAAIVTNGCDIRSVVHLGRKPTALQVTALEWISGGRCQIRGCTTNHNRLEIDHDPPWEQTQRTVLDELTLAGGHEHDLKTHRGFGFGPLNPDGTRELIPPRPPGTLPLAPPGTAAPPTAIDELDPTPDQPDLFDTG